LADGNCQNKELEQLMAFHCPATCGLCNKLVGPTGINPQCRDSATYCRRMKQFCRTPKYQRDMEQNCPFTCEFCDPNKPPMPSSPPPQPSAVEQQIRQLAQEERQLEQAPLQQVNAFVS
jgi:hypothetical protein